MFARTRLIIYLISYLIIRDDYDICYAGYAR